MSRFSFFVFALLLGSFAILGQVAVDTFLPAMPAIAKGLDTDVGAVQMALAAIFLGMGLGQLIHGPLSDRFGRKPIIMSALGVYLISCIASAWAADVETLIAWRFVQGLAAAAGRQLTNASARDLLDFEALGKMLSYVLVVAALSAVIAPIAAGHLSEAFGWRSVFFYQAGLAIVVFVLVGLFFTETLKQKNPDALSISGLLGNYREILGSPVFVGYSVLGGIALGELAAFHSTSPQFLIHGFGLSPASYGYLFAIVMIGHLIGAWGAGRLVERMGIQNVLLAGTLIFVVSALIMLFPALANIRHWSVVIPPMALLMVGFSFALPQAAAAALSPFPRIAGTAASLAGFVQSLIGAATVALLSFFDHQTQLPLAITLCVLGLAGLVLGEVLRHWAPATRAKR
ncbi:MAG: multidrug effflux MFS transporter [Rhodospirillales bacterium]|nr:multidrug effflux MFS transporter [Rhodospirillales bacterium]